MKKFYMRFPGSFLLKSLLRHDRYMSHIILDILYHIFCGGVFIFVKKQEFVIFYEEND